VESTQATQHYGVQAWNLYDEDLDAGEKTLTFRDGSVRTMAFTWYIEIGDDLLRDHTIRFPFFRSIDGDYSQDDLVFEEELFESKDKTSPRHSSKGESIKINCTVKADLRGVTPDKFQRRTDSNGTT